MLCFLLINFIEDIEIDGMLVDHFPKKKKSKLRLSLFTSAFLNGHLVIASQLSLLDHLVIAI